MQLVINPLTYPSPPVYRKLNMSKRGGAGGGRNPIFGLTGSMGKRGGGRGGFNTRYTGRRGGARRTGGRADEGNAGDVVLDRTDDGTAAQERYEEVAAMDEVDEKLGFWRFDSGKADGEEKIGWLVNMHQVSSGGQGSDSSSNSSSDPPQI